MIPQKDPTYVKWGNHELMCRLLSADVFFPIFISGLSGNGKTLMVEQVCHELHRKMLRVNITIETDEDDLIGGFRLQDGDTVWHYGPVVQAMKEGAVLLLDEVDLASNRIMCLQPILEGKPIYIKKINETIYPAKGFNIIATANTKGQGDENGKFIGTNLLNEAFLERFAICLEQDYPDKEIEEMILKNNTSNCDSHDIEVLLDWARTSRMTYDEGGSSEVISTRRLVHIVKTNNILNDITESIRLCVSRFDRYTQDSLLTFWEKMYAIEEVNTLEGDSDCQDDIVDLDNLTLF